MSRYNSQKIRDKERCNPWAGTRDKHQAVEDFLENCRRLDISSITAQERARLIRINELGQPYVAIFTSTLFTTEIPQNGSFLRILNEHYENIKFQLLMRYQPSATHNSLECVAAHLYGNLSHIQQALTRLGTIKVLTETGITCSVADLQAVLGQMLENWPREYRPK